VISLETFNHASLLAQAGGGTGGGLALLGTHLLAAIAFSVVGIAVLVTCFMIIKRMLPFSVTKEIEEDQNVALAIIIASVILGLSIIIAAAILG
jgi:putative membrane protein